MKYRENDYFNNFDDYLIHTNLNSNTVSKLHFYNGNWYSNKNLQYKMTSVICINITELL